MELLANSAIDLALFTAPKTERLFPTRLYHSMLAPLALVDYTKKWKYGSRISWTAIRMDKRKESPQYYRHDSRSVR